MIPPLDIFKMDPAGRVRWLEPATDIVAAKERLKALGTGRYMVFSQKTGTKVIFEVDENCGLSEISSSE